MPEAAMVAIPVVLRRVAAMVLVGGAVLATASQLRPGALPIGPGEGLIVLGILLAVVWTGSRSRVPAGAVTSEFLVFWLAAGACLALGALAGSWFDAAPGASAWHDAVAYAFVAAFCVSLESVASRDPVHALRILTATLAVLLFGTLMLAFGVREFGGIQLWYAVIRLRGLAENPNQLALVAIAAPFLCWQFLADRRVERRGLMWIASLACLLAGVLTWSDALLLSWALAACLLAFVAFVWLLRRTESALLILLAIALPIAAALVLVETGVAGALLRLVLEAAVDAYEAGAQGSVRLALWQSAVSATADSQGLGLGPGAHSGLSGPFGGMEAHNLYLDWMASTGVLGLLLLVGILALALIRCVHARCWHLAAALVSLYSFGMFHHSLRQPLFWCLVLIISCYTRYAVDQSSARRLAASSC